MLNYVAVDLILKKLKKKQGTYKIEVVDDLHDSVKYKGKLVIKTRNRKYRDSIFYVVDE